MSEIAWIDWQGMRLVRLACGAYEAWIAPEMGGNALRLAHHGLGVEVLRTPPSPAALRENPNVYGVPPLLPPNRIAGGAFTFGGREYAFPVNEPARGNSLHGDLSRTPMAVEEEGIPCGIPIWRPIVPISAAIPETADADGAEVILRYAATEKAPYMTFPHAFTYWVAWRLDADGLSQTIAVRNGSASRMPFGFGLHTALHVPRARRDAYRLIVPVGRQVLLDPETIHPTGEYAEDTVLHRLLNGGGLPPLNEPVSALFERLPGAAILRDTARGVDIRYEAGDGFKFWMLWNERGERDHICAEPMTWTVDAPNSPLPAEQSGFAAIDPGETKELATRLSICAAAGGN